ncbi:MAG: NUDIX hydrolase [Acidobacteria bacterium]|nr:NUDIX hydrolase [Acidobacteriota bacterium]MXZ71996.1 NUDIX hydrolase [Acidobacteriota bacterium]MYJ04744.1 NUDIX hydrolase [Acidobacteriota bacterium]
MAPGAPSGYDPRAYPPFAVTVDIAVFTIRDDALHVLLIERGQEPFKGALALPGGFVKPDEDLDEAAARELAEETGLRDGSWHLEQLGSYGAPDRDPRMRVVTVAYWAICAGLPGLRAGTDAALALLVPVEEIEVGNARLAFDHERIVRDAVERTRSKLEYTALAAKFCPPEFTIAQLRRVYEAVWNTHLDPGNFQRNVQESGAFEKRGGAVSSFRSRRGRRAALWSVRESAFSMAPPSAPLDRALARRRRPTWPQSPVMSGPPPDPSEVDAAPSADESDPPQAADEAGSPPPGEAGSPPKKDDKT